MSKDIFDLENTDDLPAELIKDLTCNSKQSRVLSLFKMYSKPLKIDQVLVGYYRLYKEELTRQQVTCAIYQLTKKKQLKKLKDGKWKKVTIKPKKQ